MFHKVCFFGLLKKTALKSNYSIFYLKYVKQRLRKLHCALKLFPFPASTYYSLHSMYSQFLWDSFFGRCYIDTMFWNDIATGQPDQHENPFHNGAKQFLKFLHYSHLPCGPAMLSRQKSSRDPPETPLGGSPDFFG